jgi:hypothetical protein
MGRDGSGSCCDRTHEDQCNRDGWKTEKRSAWAVTPATPYTSNYDYLSADEYNLLINEMNINKSNMGANVSVPGYIGSGTPATAAMWNATCDRIIDLINAAKSKYSLMVLAKGTVNRASGPNNPNYRDGTAENRGTPLAISATVSEVNAKKYSNGEMLTRGKTIGDLINIVRRARVHCTCNVDNYEYKPCNCDGHVCRHRDCCDKTGR